MKGEMPELGSMGQSRKLLWKYSRVGSNPTFSGKLSFSGNIKIYTDGSCINNPGEGGYASLIIIENRKFLISEYQGNTTNNRMELLSVISALKCVDGFSQTIIDIITDSSYVCNGINLWIQGWKKKNWKTASGTDVLNKDLWLEYIDVSKNFTINISWIRAHTNQKDTDSILNDIVDKKAKESIVKKNDFLIEEL